MSAIRPARHVWLTFDQIDLPENGRPYNAADVTALANSIRAIGLQSPLTVIERDGRHLLIAGRHRLEALRVIGEERVPCRVVDFDDGRRRRPEVRIFSGPPRHAIKYLMKPSVELDAHSEEIRRIVAEHNGLNPRVFGSTGCGKDEDNSDLDLLIDAGEGLDLFDIAKMQMAVEALVHAPVDIRTPEDIAPRFRQQVLAEAKPL